LVKVFLDLGPREHACDVRDVAGHPRHQLPRLSTVAWLVFALTLLGAFLRFAGIGAQGFWFDEANTALLVHLSPGKMLGLIPRSESTPPLYYCVAWLWARVFGYGEAGLRSLSALAGVATIPLMYGAAAKLFSRRVGLIIAALTACSPLLIWYSQEARSYALLVALSAASLLAFAYALDRPVPRPVACWAVAAALALAAHYYAILVVVPEAVWLLLAHRSRRTVQLGIAAVALCGLALIPLAISQNATGNSSWIAPIPLRPRLAQVIPQFLIGFQAPVQKLLQTLAAAMALIGLGLLTLRAEPASRRRALAVLGVAVGGLALNLALIAGGTDDLITRNVIALWLPAALVVAAGLGARRAGVLGLVAAAVLCATGVVAAVGVTTDRSFQRPDWRPLASTMGPRPPAQSRGRVIVIQRYRDLLPLSLSLPGLHFMRSGSAEVNEFDVISISAPRVALCWWGAACNLSPSTPQRSYPLPGFHVAWLRRVRQFTVVQMESPRPVRVTRADVSRALTTTPLARDDLLLQR
jgi:mannosyltransferase